MSDRQSNEHGSARTPEATIDRRAALAKLGRYGAYTAPALLALLEAGKAVASSAPRVIEE